MKALVTILTVLSPIAAAATTQTSKPASIVPAGAQLDIKLPAAPYAKEDGSLAMTSTTYRAPEELAAPMSPATPMFKGLDRNRVHHDVDAQGLQWARGATYKASFGQGAATYIPFFGSKAPQNYPVTFRLANVTVAGEPIEFVTDSAATRAGHRVALDRGAFVECYDMAARSMEQSFVFSALVEGEIVVQIGVETELTSAVDDAGFRFENELGHVRYGHAFALDAAGRKAQLDVSLENGTITIRVPEEFVAAATFPLIIDPAASTFQLESHGLDELAPDTSYDISFGTWVTVCQEAFSVADHDIHAVRHGSTGTISATTYIDFSTVNWTHARIANNNISNAFLVVAQAGVVGSRTIRSRLVGADLAMTLGGVQQVNEDAFMSDVLNPDVGGDPDMTSPTYFFVVWEREYSATDRDIHARRVLGDGAPNGATILLENSAATVDIEPAVSNSDGAGVVWTAQHWTVVWTRQTATDDDILGARANWDCSIAESAFSVGFTTLDERAASASPILTTTSLGLRYMVAYQIDGGTQGWDVRMRAFDNTTILATLDSDTAFPSTASLEQTLPSCDTDGHQFLVAYRENPAFFSTTEILVSTVYLVGNSLGITEGAVSVTPGLELDSRPEIVSKHASGSSVEDALVVFDRSDAGNLEVFGTLYDIPVGGPKTAYCFGDGTGTACPCGNSGGVGRGCASSVNASGALLTSTGNAALSTDNLRLLGSGMGATATCLYFQGTAATNSGNGTAFGDGLRCASGSVIRLGTKTNVAGASQYPAPGDLDISERGLVPDAGAVRYYQLWYRNNAVYCTASNFNLTNALRVVWVP